MSTPLSPDQDDFIWLEGINEPTALQWVEQQNKTTLQQFSESEAFSLLRDDVFKCLNTDSQIPTVMKCGPLLYNFWQDEKNPRGILRRTTLDSYRQDKPLWEEVLDLDALNQAEGKEWVYHGMQPLKPDYQRCLLHFSPDGGDASAIREFDLQSLSFVEQGFSLPSAKSRVSWIDQDHLFVATDFGPDSLTTSSYPRIAKIWQRATPLEEAKTVFSADIDDMMVIAYHDSEPGYARNFVERVIDFYRHETFQLDPERGLLKLEIPDDAKFSTWKQWLLLELSSDWTVAEQHYRQGSLLAIDFNAFMAGDRQFTLLFAPEANTALTDYSSTRDYLILSIMQDVANHLEVLTPQPGEWLREPLGSAPALSTIQASGIDENTNDYFMTVTGFLQPTTLYLGSLDKNNTSSAAEILKQDPSHFDADGYLVEQHFAESEDGTQVPYFVISSKTLPKDGTTPTLLYGYGGFEVSLTPYYLGITGRTWLARGGAFVIANIRGGGEYGPRWHQAALKQHRLRAYEDFAAVARGVIASKLTSPAHLAAEGGSNGGLLVGNMLTRYPQLFGAIVCEVALLDMYRYTQISAGASWIAEYGDPQDPQQWEFIQHFSPYHNIDSAVNYPPVLFTTATSDDRVGPVHARKMAARMQKLGIEEVYFYENTQGGHSAAADKAQRAFHRALISEFLMNKIGHF